MANIDSIINKVDTNSKFTDDLKNKLLESLKNTKNALNDFYNEEISKLNDENGNPIDPSTIPDSAKLPYLKSVLSLNGTQGDGFYKRLSMQTEEIDKSKNNLKEAAKNILEMKQGLIDENKKNIEEARKILEQSDKEKKEQIEMELLKISEDVTNKEREIDTETDPAKKEELQKELDGLLNEKNVLEQDLSDVQTNNANKKEIDNLEEKNKEFEKSLQKDISLFAEEFEKAGIKFENENVNLSKENSEGDLEKTKNNKPENRNFGNSAQGINIVASQELKKSMVTISDKVYSKNVQEAFLNASYTDQKQMLNGYMYDNIVNSSENLSIWERRKLNNAIAEHVKNSIPNDHTNFNKAILSIKGAPPITFADLCDSKGNMISFDKLEVEQLRDIQETFDSFNKTKDNMSQEQIEFFEDNFMNLVKNNALLQKVKTGNIKNTFNNVFKREKTTLNNNIINGMSSYYNKRAERIKSDESKKNMFIEGLGANVKIDPKSIETVTQERVKAQDDISR